MSEAPRRAPWAPSAGVVADVAAVVVVCAVVTSVWRGMGARTGPAPAGAPAWATPHDLLLFGPDAGMWAANAMAIHLGRWELVDPHRMPTWSLIVAVVLHVQPDVAIAAHLTNHALRVALPLVVYVVGAATGGRGAGFAAALACAVLSPVVLASASSSVDPLVALAQPLALLGGVLAARVPLLSPVGGALAGLATLSHLTTLGVWGPGLVMAFALGRAGWRRWASLVGFAIGAALALRGITDVHPMLPWNLFVDSLAEGVSPESVAHANRDLTTATDRVLAGLPSAADATVATILGALRPRWLPWHAALVLPWLGVLGLFLPVAPDTRPVRPPRRWARAYAAVHAVWRGGLHLLPGLAILVGLTPMFAFAAAGSPTRYSVMFLPTAALLLARGLASAFGAIDLLILRRWARWPQGGLVAASGVAWAWMSIDPATRPLGLGPPRLEHVATRTLGATIARHFGPGGGVACMIREAAPYAGRGYCPTTQCPSHARAIGKCLEVLREECTGEGPVPYVVAVRPKDDRAEWRATLDAWIAERYDPIEVVNTPEFVAEVYAIPREEP